MSRARRAVFFSLVALQAVIPLGMVAAKESHLASGERVRLATEPLDPLDVFRGRYVQLRYTISSLPADPTARGGETVYVPLFRRGDVWEGFRTTRSKPEDGTFIRGRITSVGGGMAQIAYGIETHFVDERDASDLEAATARGDVLVEVVLDGDGGALIDRVILP
jgi:uncharacterized membrane-anchored protein